MCHHKELGIHTYSCRYLRKIFHNSRRNCQNKSPNKPLCNQHDCILLHRFQNKYQNNCHHMRYNYYAQIRTVAGITMQLPLKKAIHF